MIRPHVIRTDSRIAAYFVQHLITTYEQHFSTLQSASADLAVDETLGKECSNLIILLSELYNFQVISCVLVYDLIQGLLDGDLSELKVELLLKIVRSTFCIFLYVQVII